MTMQCSPRLADMVRRCALPISVRMMDDRFGLRFDICITDIPEWFPPTEIVREVTASPRSASMAYFDLVSTLETKPAASTSAVTGDGCSAPASPGGEL